MAVTATPVFPQTITNKVQQISNTDGTTDKTLYAAGVNGSKVDAIFATSTDTSARDVALSLLISGTKYILGTVTVPATAGFVNNVPTVDLLRAAQIPAFAYDAFGNRILYLANGTTLQVAVLTSVASAKLISVVCQGADF